MTRPSDAAIALKPCPFCAVSAADDLIDTLYPSGTAWRVDNGRRHYIGINDPRGFHGLCWNVVCSCGAEVSADSREEVIARWNRRAIDAEAKERIAAGSDNGPRPLDYTPGELDRTAPKRIWLQIDTNGDNDDRDEPCPELPGAEISWCWESIGGLEVEYVRADLVAEAKDAVAVAARGRKKCF